jgi:hypothetical protein
VRNRGYLVFATDPSKGVNYRDELVELIRESLTASSRRSS